MSGEVQVQHFSTISIFFPLNLLYMNLCIIKTALARPAE